jgi:hypothetical protein
VSEQRIEFDFHRLSELTGDHLLGDMAISKNPEARKSRERLMNTVLAYVLAHFENGEDGDTEDEGYGDLKEYPASNGDDSAVLKLYDGPKISRDHVDDLLTECTLDALDYWENNPDATPYYDESDDREDNPAKFRTEEYDGSTEKRIYPEDIAKVYPALRGAMRSLTKHKRGDVIDLLWSFIAATIEESPILQKAGWVVGRQPDGDNFAVYYETCPRGQSFEDIIEQDAILAVKEAAGGRSDNPGKSGLPLGSLALGAALGAAAIHLFKKRGQ